MRRRVALAPLAAFLLVSAGCGGSPAPVQQNASGADKVTVGVIPIVDVAPIYLGKQLGYFSDAKIDLTLVQAQGGAAIVPAVVSGQEQFGFSNMTSLMLAQSKGLGLKVVAAGNSSTGKAGADFSAVVVRGDSTIKTAADLEGKTVSINTLKNIGDTTVRASVRKAGGDPDKVKFTELALPDMGPALANKRIDAAWLVEPFLTAALNSGDRAIAWNLVDTSPGLMIAAYFTSARFMTANPDLVQRFAAAVNKSLEYANSHPDEVRKILPTYTKINAETAAKLTLPAWPTQINRQSTEVLAQLAVDDGLMATKPDLNTLLP